MKYLFVRLCMPFESLYFVFLRITLPSWKNNLMESKDIEFDVSIHGIETFSYVAVAAILLFSSQSRLSTPPLTVSFRTQARKIIFTFPHNGNCLSQIPLGPAFSTEMELQATIVAERNFTARNRLWRLCLAIFFHIRPY